MGVEIAGFSETHRVFLWVPVNPTSGIFLPNLSFALLPDILKFQSSRIHEEMLL